MLGILLVGRVEASPPSRADGAPLYIAVLSAVADCLDLEITWDCLTTVYHVHHLSNDVTWRSFDIVR